MLFDESYNTKGCNSVFFNSIAKKVIVTQVVKMQMYFCISNLEKLLIMDWLFLAWMASCAAEEQEREQKTLERAMWGKDEWDDDEDDWDDLEDELDDDADDWDDDEY